MQACQPITAVASYTESHSRHAPSNRAFKSKAKIRLGKLHFIDVKKHATIIRATQETL